jgi:hypothetical protein
LVLYLKRIIVFLIYNTTYEGWIQTMGTIPSKIVQPLKRIPKITFESFKLKSDLNVKIADKKVEIVQS